MHTEKTYPLVSVIIPVYNMEKYLEETLNSVLASTYSNIEIVLVDDGSNDRSFSIAQSYEELHTNVLCFKQGNAGVSSARNNAIRKAKGKYILPVDADDLIADDYIESAVNVIESDPAVKVVYSTGEFIGERKGHWKRPPFSLHLLARKNMIDICALFYRSDWERVGGYTEEVTGREDWMFWIAVLKDGGKVVQLPKVGLFYRIRDNSKRITDRTEKKKVINYLNEQHPEFFRRELNGPLRYNRSWSRVFNTIANFLHYKKVVVHSEYKSLADFLHLVPKLFAWQQGNCIYKGRNELRSFDVKGYELVVKSYKRPHFINRIVYGFLRKSKAQRAYEYGLVLLDNGIGTPQPIGFVTRRRWFLFADSYSVSLKSTLPYVYNDLKRKQFERQDEILQAIACTTARMHNKGILHKDFSGGNILFDDKSPDIPIELVDLNRLVFGNVNEEEGCKNFERLPGTDHMISLMGTTYAKERGYNKDNCIKKMKSYIDKEIAYRAKQKRKREI